MQVFFARIPSRHKEEIGFVKPEARSWKKLKGLCLDERARKGDARKMDENVKISERKRKMIRRLSSVLNAKRNIIEKAWEFADSRYTMPDYSIF